MKLRQKLAIGYIRLKFKALVLVSKKKAAEQAFKLFCTPLTDPPTRKPTVFKYAEELQFKLNGHNIKGYRWNHKKPYKVLILHGFSSASFKFSNYVEPLIEKGYEVLAFDAPAHGGSGGKTVNALQYSDMIVHVTKKFGPVNGFIAHSFGGIALALTLEKIKHDENTKVVFIAPATETSSAIDGAFTMLQINDAAVRKEFDNVIIEKSGQHPKWFSIKRAMKNITATILWVHDEDDSITPLEDALQVKEKNFPNIEFMITQGLGHRRIYHDAAVKKKVVNFL
jgi:pimeloyl-ACP methyl ester carboxylesterase